MIEFFEIAILFIWFALWVLIILASAYKGIKILFQKKEDDDPLGLNEEE